MLLHLNLVFFKLTLGKLWFVLAPLIERSIFGVVVAQQQQQPAPNDVEKC
jgi:hypothetical protein